MTLTKANIIDSIQQEFNINRNKAAKIVETLLDIIKDRLETGEDVLISGFGKFCVKEKGKRKGRNPVTGDSMMLDKRRVVTFKYSAKLKKKINNLD